MFDASTLKPINSYRTLETLSPHRFGLEVEILKASNGSHRFCHIAPQGGELSPYDSCLIVGADKTIVSVYTKPDKRRQGIAKQLLVIARLTLGTVYHSDNLTEKGRLWRNSVENLK